MKEGQFKLIEEFAASSQHMYDEVVTAGRIVAWPDGETGATDFGPHWGQVGRTRKAT